MVKVDVAPAFDFIYVLTRKCIRIKVKQQKTGQAGLCTLLALKVDMVKGFTSLIAAIFVLKLQELMGLYSL